MVMLNSDQVLIFKFKIVDIAVDSQSEHQKGLAAASAAIEQIRQHGYMEKYRRRYEPIYLIGVAFNKWQGPETTGTHC